MGKVIFICLLAVFLTGCQEDNQVKKVSKTQELTYREDSINVNLAEKEISKEKPSYYTKGDWKLVWEDDFTSKSVNSKKWNVVRQGDNYNNELQYYLPKNVIQSDDELKLVAKKENYKKHHYTSGKITTEDKFTFKYGKVEFRMKYPSGKGMFPAVWMLPASGKSSLPEIDLFESIGSDANTMYMVNHVEENGTLKSEHDTTQIEKHWEYHIYEMEWNENALIWTVDGKDVYEINNNVPNEAMYLLINLAIGGNWEGNPNEQTIFPSEVSLDYVRVYEKIKQRGL